MRDVSRLIAPPADTPLWIAAAETVTLTGLAVVAGGVIQPGDPFFLDSSYCWLTFAPLLAGLRYRLAAGIGSAAMLCALMGGAHHAGIALAGGSLPLQGMLGLTLVGIAAGQMGAIWRRRVGRAQLNERYHRLRLDEFTRSYHLLLQSHRSLERRVIGEFYPLEHALTDLRDAWLERELADAGLESIAERVVLLFEQFGNVEVGAVYPVSEGSLGAEPAAACGRPRPVREDDPLIREVLEHAETTTITAEAPRATSRLLVAVPLADLRGRLHGVVAIERMPFVALERERVRELSILGSYVGSLLGGFRGTPGQGERSAAEFARELSAFAELGRRFGLVSSLAGVSVATGGNREIIARRIEQTIRNLDRGHVARDRNGAPVVLLLLPATTPEMFEGFRTRLQQRLEEELGITDALPFHLRAIGGGARARELLDFLDRSLELSDDDRRRLLAFLH